MMKMVVVGVVIVVAVNLRSCENFKNSAFLLNNCRGF
jgi:hypothetical protein